VKDLEVKVTKANANNLALLHLRIAQVSEIIKDFAQTLPQDAARIEVDIEYADGGRVKIEGRA
jgi:hypothetical protein